MFGGSGRCGRGTWALQDCHSLTLNEQKQPLTPHVRSDATSQRRDMAIADVSVEERVRSAGSVTLFRADAESSRRVGEGPDRIQMIQARGSGELGNRSRVVFSPPDPFDVMDLGNGNHEELDVSGPGIERKRALNLATARRGMVWVKASLSEEPSHDGALLFGGRHQDLVDFREIVLSAQGRIGVDLFSRGGGQSDCVFRAPAGTRPVPTRRQAAHRSPCHHPHANEPASREDLDLEAPVLSQRSSEEGKVSLNARLLPAATLRQPEDVLFSDFPDPRKAGAKNALIRFAGG